MKNARDVALNALKDITENDLYSNIAVNNYLKKSNLKDIDRGFATEIIYGTLENKIFLDYVINQFSKIKVKKLSSNVRCLLEMGIYQIMFLNSVAEFAAVNECVNLCKKYDRRSAGFVNGVLRNIIRNKENIKYPDKSDMIKYLSVKYSCSEWIIKNWIEEFGEEFTQELLIENNEKPDMYARVNTLKISKENLLEKLKQSGVECEDIRLIPEAIKLKNMKNLENNELFKLGYFQIQDISSMIIGHVINPSKNMNILDVCAAPGGKSTHLAALMKNTGKIVSRDVFEHKLRLIDENAKRLGITNITPQICDALVLDNESINSYDVVLVDAPCSGFGIIRRKPEIKYKKEEDLKSLNEIQFNILKNSSNYVKCGGMLIYSTCTIQENENLEIVNKFINENPNFVLEPIDNIKIDLENQESGYIKLYPNVHGMDGFFIAKLKRVR